jgi:hypothetical protein
MVWYGKKSLILIINVKIILKLTILLQRCKTYGIKQDEFRAEDNS